MKVLLKYVLFGMLSFPVQNLLQAQDPTDCTTAIPICSSQQLNYNSNGAGVDDFGPGPNLLAYGCLTGGEHQSAWFEIYIAPSSPPGATLAFTITPTAGFGEDYDFAVWGPNVDCTGLGDPIRCSWAGGSCSFCPETGLGMGATDFSEGVGGDGFVAIIETQPGESYILLVDNYNASSQGFFLDWTGTAILSCSCTTIPVITGDLEVCDGETTTLTVTGTGLTDYQWAATAGGGISGPTDGVSIVALTEGTYHVSVTDSEGCTGSAFVEITAAPGPEIDFSVESATCGQSNGSIGLTISGGTGPYIFVWSNGATTEDISGLPTGSYSVTVTSSDGCSGTLMIEVPENNPALDISGIIVDNSSCIEGNGNITITVTPAGVFTYEWSNGENTADIYDLTAGTYMVTVTSVGSCTGTASFTIEDDLIEPDVTANTVPSLCDMANGTIDITVVGGVQPYLYEWTGGETTEDLENISAGNYSLTVTGDNGCSTILSLVLTNDNPLIEVTANIDPNTSCNDQNGAIFTMINPATSPTGEPYTYSWSTGSSDQQLTQLAPGTYTLTVSGGGSCTEEVTFTVPDEPDVPQLNATIEASTCGQDDGAIQLTVIGGISPFTYLWSNGSITQNLSDLIAGNYSVTVTADNGCTTESTFTVPDESVSFTVNALIEPNTSCTGGDNGSITITVVPAGSYVYTWSNGEDGEMITDLSAGSYTLTVSAGGNCEQELTFVVADEPLLPQFDTDITPSSCGEPDGSATIIPTAGEEPFTFLWSNGEGTQSIQNVEAGTYTVTVTGSNGCMVSVPIVIPNAQVAITVDAEITANTSCVSGNGSIDLTISPTSGLTFQWSSGESVPDLDNLAAGSYSLTVSAGGNCTEVFAFDVPDEILIPVINLTTVSSLCGQANGSIDLTMSIGEAPFEFSWSGGDIVEDISGLIPGTYTVTVTDALGCTASATATVNNNTVPIDISGFAEPNTSCESPNGEVSITIAPPGMYNYVWSNGETTEDLSNLEPGSYTITVTLGDICSAATTFTVGDETSDPIVNAVVTAAICDEDNGSIDLTISGSEPPYSVLWSHGEVDEDVTDLFPGMYSVTVTGANDCATVLQVNVPNNSSAFSIAGNVSPLTSCAQSNGAVDVTMDPPGSYAFLWSNGETTEDIANLGPGDYTVTVTQAGSCSGTMTFSITDETSSPSYTATIANDLCNQSLGSIDLLNITGEQPITILWSNGEISVNNDSLSAGTYTVTVTDVNGCTSSSTHVIVSNSSDISVVGSALPNTSCATPNGSVDITVSPAAAYTWLWSNGDTTEDLLGVISGNYSVTVSLGSCTATSTFFVGADASAISLNTAVANVSCYGGNDGWIDLEVGGGMPPFIFSWDPPVTGTPEDLTDIVAGEYAVTVTDQAGCTITSSFIITDPPMILLSCNQTASVSTPGATDGSAAVQITGGTPPYAITWTPGNTQSGLPTGTFAISSLGEGEYQVEVIDANGCIATCSFTITAEDCTTSVGSMDSQPLVICGMGCAFVSYDISGQTLNPGDVVQFILHEGAGNQIQNEIARAVIPQFCFDAGIMQFNTQYFISAVAGPDDGSGNVVLSGACTQTTVGTPVMFREIPLATIDNPNQIDCDNPEIALTGNSSIALSTFAWSSKVGNILTDPAVATILVNAGGYYELVVTSNTCKDTAGVEVEQSDDYPALLTAPVGTLNCRDSLVTLSGSTMQPGVELLWVTIVNNDTTVIGSGESLIVNTPGTYYLLGIAENGCTSSKALTVNELLSAPDVDAGEDITLSCDQSSLNILAIASDDVEYLWTAPPGVSLPINNTPSVLIDKPGVYVVLVTDTLSFCTDTDSIEVIASQETPISTIIADHVSCFGEANGSIIVQPEQGQGPFTFLINGEDSGEINLFTSLAPGLFIIEVIDAGGCRWSTEVEITEPEPMVVDLGADLSVDPGEVITLEVQTNLTTDQIESVVWTPDQGIKCLDEPCTSIRFELFTPEEMMVTVTDTNGCVGSDALSILVVDDRHFFAPNIFSPNSDGKNDAFTLFAGPGVRALRSLRVFDRWGELIFETDNIAPNDLSAGWDGTFRGKPLDPGVFLWQAEIEYQSGDAELRYGDVTLLR